jgi:alkylhydroperoxidase/carboxymuconolactone decarboxylase family protein YurZ
VKIEPCRKFEIRWFIKLGRGGGNMAHEPLKVLEKLDPSLLELTKRSSDFALSEGALPRKFKLLIAMALDASKGAEGGVRALAKSALQAGATKDEIAETLRVAFYIAGVGAVYTSAQGLKDVI